MSVLPIVKYPSPLLQQPSSDALLRNQELEQLAQDMFDTMRAARGVGLAAIQVGVPLRLFVIDVVQNKQRKQAILINPKKLSSAGQLESIEGCLSYPGYEGTVQRAAKIVMEAMDLSQHRFKIKAEGLLSRVLQHEYDHLDGIMYLDKLVEGSLHSVKQQGEF